MRGDFSDVTSGSSTSATGSSYSFDIPHHLSAMERDNWLWAYGSRPSVQRYLGSPQQTPWGIIERATDFLPGLSGEFLLYVPQLGGGYDPANLHITLVTGLPIVAEVQKAPYKSPDDVGFFENLQRQINDTLAGANTFANYALLGLGLLVALQVLRK